MTEDIPKTLGRYEIVGELGKGAMGIVYEGRDPNIGRRVAIKTARRDVLDASGRADELMERFLREAKAAGGLNHPNIVTIYDADEEHGMAYIAMEFLEGGDLKDYLAEKKFIEPEHVVEITATVCEALAVAHKEGIVHRDIKPANIMMLQDGGIKLADFGIAHMEDSSLTQEGAMIGTPQYMSPEQFQGRKIDARSDLFSVGIVAYELLTNEKPFTGEALSTVMTSVIKSNPIPPNELNSMVGETLSRVVMKALEKNPRMRYQSGKEMAAALREALEPNPDPQVTLLTQLGADDKTVIAGASGDAETVLVSGAPEGQFIEPGGSPVASAEAPPEAVAPAGEPPAPGEPVKKAQKSLGQRSPVAALAVGVGLVAVAAAILYFSFAGEKVGNYYSTAEITVMLCPNQAAYDEWSGAAVPDSWIPADDATVTVYDSKAEMHQIRSITTRAGVAKVTLPGNYDRVFMVVGKKGYGEDDHSSVSAQKAGDTATWEFTLLHESVDEAKL